MKKSYWLCLLWLVSLLVGCESGPPLTPTPPKLWGVPASVEAVSIENQADSFTVSFYLTDLSGHDTVWDGTALLQVIGPARLCSHQPTEPYSDEVMKDACLLFRQVAKVKAEDFVWSQAEVVSTGGDELRREWHYWYSFPPIPYASALEEIYGSAVILATYETGVIGHPNPREGGQTVVLEEGQFKPALILPH